MQPVNNPPANPTPRTSRRKLRYVGPDGHRDIPWQAEPDPTLQGPYRTATARGFDLFEDFHTRSLSCIARGTRDPGSHAVTWAPKLTIFTVNMYPPSSGNNFRRLVFNNHVGYAVHHGYRYCSLHTPLDPSRHPSWQKIPAALLLLPVLRADDEILLMLDADALIVDRPRPLYPLLAGLMAGKPALFADDPAEHGAPDFNLGVFAVKKHGWVVEMMQHLYNETRVLGTREERMLWE